MNALTNFWLRGAALHLWQATLFGLAIALVIALLPGPARLRHFAGCLALLRFLLPAGLLAPLIGFLQWAAPGGAWLPARLSSLWLPPFIVSGNAGETPSATVLHLPDAGLLATIWAIGAVLLLGAGMIRLVRGLQAVKRGQIPFSATHRERLGVLAGRAGIRPGKVTGYYVPSSGWLGVVGLFRSRVIVPEGLFSTLEDREVDSVLLHELMHVKRHDNLLRLCQSGVVAIFWFHPLVWWLDRRLRWESERACDEGVLRLTGASRVYASGLFKAMRFALGLNLPGVSGMSRLRLQSRIQAVLNHQNRKDSPVKLTITASALVALFGLATLVASTPAASDGTAAPAAPGSKVFNISELDQIPMARVQAPPVYPAELRKAGMCGEAIVGFVVDEQGNVGDVRVVPPKDPKDARKMKMGDVEITLINDERFDQAAMEAVRQWKFTPGKKDGKPVKVLLSVPIVFTFKD
jgi:beta-lactamase regulating signal transducer with metallopeptidase domain